MNRDEKLKEYAKEQALQVESIDMDILEQLVIDGANWQEEQEQSRCKKKHCKGCESEVDKVSNIHGVELCDSCNNTYDNKTGYCSLSCCLGYGCDESC